MSTEQAHLEYFYYPSCRTKNCNGILKFNINKNFSLDYKCEKNEDHKDEKIYFKTFERFYLKKKEIDKCSKCFSILESDYIYKCKKCDKNYCPTCFTNDEHIKKNNSELIKKLSISIANNNYFFILLF